MFTLGARELIIGLGSNDPDAANRLRRARQALRERFRLIGCSPLYESEAMLPPDAPESWNIPYLNAACRVETDETSATRIVAILKQIEQELGRVAAPRWSPRVIDLDLLAWGRPPAHEGDVRVPHAGLQERPFALLPALDCAGHRSTHPWRYLPDSQVPQKTRPAQTVWPELVGVINLTPDSFSDGGAHSTPARIEQAALALLDAGATVIDAGAESTRPGATPVSSPEEISRLEPGLEVLARLRESRRFKLSLDSRHPETVRWALERTSLDWINDVEGFSSPALLELAARSGADLVVMHSLGVPPTAQTLPTDRDPLDELLAWGRARIDDLKRAGVPRSRIILDPGLGFGKTAAQNLAILARAHELNSLGTRILVGHSRKRFLDLHGALAASERDLETAILSAHLANSGADYLRVHAPGPQLRALRLGARLG